MQKGQGGYIMYKRNLKELKLQRGYSEIIYLMRIANVNTDTIGYELLQIAIMSYLHDSSLKIQELVEIATKNAPMYITEEACFEKMKDALQNLHTKHLEKLDDNNVVFKFIKNIASDVRMRELIKMRVESEGLTQVTEKIISLFSETAIRRIMKPKHTFNEVLKHVVLKEKYDDTMDLVLDLYNVQRNNNMKEEIISKLSKIKDPNKRIKEKKAIVEPIQKEVEQLVDAFVKEHENLVF